MAIVCEVKDRAADLATRLGGLLLSRGWTLAVAESCTGGLIGHYVTNVSGSSGYFEGGVISYANRIKQEVVGVPEELLIAHGAVSAPVASAMARGVRRLIGADVAIAVTGIAGPTGGTPEKPVGTVFVAVSTPEGQAVRHCLWRADREGNKQLSAAAALELAIELVQPRE